MSKELLEAVKLFISQPLNNPLNRGQIMEVARIALPILEQQEAKKQVSLREGIDTIRSAIAESGGYNFEALREQQERGEGEWIEWGGGECPCDYLSIVEVRLRSGNEREARGALSWEWKHYNSICDIIAYRIIPERATNENGDQ